jgi:phospholipid/cholesterol/gamma-HCH transport system ATP-binding protein
MAEPSPILQFDRASLCPLQQPDNCLAEVTLTLGPGAVAVVDTGINLDIRELGFDYFPLADAAEGLLPCQPGQVLFLGRDWAKMGPLEQARNRGKIGRVFDYHGWVHNLSVMENLVTACRTHPNRAIHDPEGTAEKLARRYGLEGVPNGRPALMRKRDLRRCEWIRAFLGNPDLVILERPEMDAPRGALDALFETAREAQGRGAALLWITHDKEIKERAVRLGAAQFAVRGRTWHRREETER